MVMKAPVWGDALDEICSAESILVVPTPAGRLFTQADAPDGLPVHVSGHAGRAELATMHRLARPRFAIPVHGTDMHLRAHASLALDCGAEAAPVGMDGGVMAVSASGIKLVGRVEIPVIGIRRDNGALPNSVVSGKTTSRTQRPAMNTAA